MALTKKGQRPTGKLCRTPGFNFISFISPEGKVGKVDCSFFSIEFNSDFIRGKRKHETVINPFGWTTTKEKIAGVGNDSNDTFGIKKIGARSIMYPKAVVDETLQIDGTVSKRILRKIERSVDFNNKGELTVMDQRIQYTGEDKIYSTTKTFLLLDDIYLDFRYNMKAKTTFSVMSKKEVVPSIECFLQSTKQVNGHFLVEPLNPNFNVVNITKMKKQFYKENRNG